MNEVGRSFDTAIDFTLTLEAACRAHDHVTARLWRNARRALFFDGEVPDWNRMSNHIEASIKEELDLGR